MFLTEMKEKVKKEKVQKKKVQKEKVLKTFLKLKILIEKLKMNIKCKYIQYLLKNVIVLKKIKVLIQWAKKSNRISS